MADHKLVNSEQIGFGGSCHWCTEAIFLSLKGVISVQQGWIASDESHSTFSEGVIVEFNPALISLGTLVIIHLYTHSCTSDHRMRVKYRSAVYTYDKRQSDAAAIAIQSLQKEFAPAIITQILPLIDFKINSDEFLNYYYSNPQKPFCENVVNPKLRLLMAKFADQVNNDRLIHLEGSS